jgi:hypothetical protein
MTAHFPALPHLEFRLDLPVCPRKEAGHFISLAILLARVQGKALGSAPFDGGTAHGKQAHVGGITGDVRLPSIAQFVFTGGGGRMEGGRMGRAFWHVWMT